jgi:NAD-dependent DNA ligase
MKKKKIRVNIEKKRGGFLVFSDELSEFIPTAKCYPCVVEAIYFFNNAVEEAIEMFKKERPEVSELLRNVIIKEDLSNEAVHFVFDALSWKNYEVVHPRAIINDNVKVFKPKAKAPAFLWHEHISGEVLQPNFRSVVDKNNPFFKAKVVFTGELSGLSRNDAAAKIKLLGADVDTNIGRYTSMVIVGNDPGAVKLKTVASMNASGGSIRLIYEAEFLEMLKECEIEKREAEKRPQIITRQGKDSWYIDLTSLTEP